MRPQEKAQELFNKYATYVVMWTGGLEVERQNCKQCALIAVDCIITSNPHSNPLNTEVYSTMGYWQEVKKEIEKL